MVFDTWVVDGSTLSTVTLRIVPCPKCETFINLNIDNKCPRCGFIYLLDYVQLK